MDGQSSISTKKRHMHKAMAESCGCLSKPQPYVRSQRLGARWRRRPGAKFKDRGSGVDDFSLVALKEVTGLAGGWMLR